MQSIYQALEPLPDNHYADQLRKGFPRLRFAALTEKEYLSYLHWVQGRYQRIAALLALVIWVAFALTDQSRLQLWQRFPDYDPERWALLVVRGSITLVLALLVLTLFTPKHRRYSQTVVMATQLSVALGSTLAVLLYERLSTPISNSVVLLNAITLFFPLGLSWHRSIVTALISVPLILLPGIFLLENPTPHLRLSLMYVLALIVSGIGGYIRDHLQREQFLLLRLLQWQSGHDPLTGLSNRRSFAAHIEKSLSLSRREQRNLGLLILDIDHFKAYNDHYGHLAGDEALRQIGQLLQSFARRPMDMAVRLGGEEFALLLYDLPQEQLARIAEQIRQALANLHIPHAASTTAEYMTASIGGCLATPEESSTEFYNRTDLLLYEAKSVGRNRSTLG
ncbi:conserved membrane hypothetical protein [Pseudomonas sp. 8Z]|uniref:GGDEF domain-containing protein n=1 Tax=Pseudomonas sp. 8Z TaxID=2653166 RepID=UPI0012F06F1E|nr:diguanylate cyclase [Pseudomonas sp. 8Z]VXC74219.1 conserved membrane hypothetical protein [Pseudomonas sp. 8Z]